MNARGRRTAQQRAALALLASLSTAVSHADQWTTDAAVEARLELNDNPALTAQPSGGGAILSASASLQAARNTEASALRLKLDLAAVRPSRRRSDSRTDGRIELSQTVKGPRSQTGIVLTLSQDFNSDLLSADITQPRGQRRTQALSAQWRYGLSERLSLSTQAAVTRAGYGETLTSASDYRNISLSGGLSYLWSERDTLSLQFGLGRYRTLAGSGQADTTSLDLGLSRELGEAASVSLSLGAYRTVSGQLGGRLACPLEAGFCEAGIVPYVLVIERRTSTRRGLQVSASGRVVLDETTSLGFSASRQVAPSGAGTVVRNDSVSLTAERRFSPTLAGTATYGLSRANYGSDNGGLQAGQQVLALSLSRQLDTDLSVQAGFRHTAADVGATGARAQSRSLTVTLRVDLPHGEIAR